MCDSSPANALGAAVFHLQSRQVPVFFSLGRLRQFNADVAVPGNVFLLAEDNMSCQTETNESQNTSDVAFARISSRFPGCLRRVTLDGLMFPVALGYTQRAEYYNNNRMACKQ